MIQKSLLQSFARMSEMRFRQETGGSTLITRRALLGTTIAASGGIFSVKTARSQDFKLRWGHSMPATHSLTKRGQEAVDKIRQETNGRIDIQIFPDNQLGGDNDMTAQVRAGALEV